MPVNAVQMAPSLFVTRTLDPVLTKRCAHFGLVPIESTCDDFLRDLDRRCRPRVQLHQLLGRHDVEIFARAPDPKDERIFWRQWLRIAQDELPDPIDNRHLLEGVEPTWKHVRDGEAVLRQDARLIVDDALKWRAGKPRMPVTKVLHAAAGDGKTTAAMRAAYELANAGVPTFFFQGHERLDDSAGQAVIACLKSPGVLFVDSASDQAFQVADLVRRCRETSTPVYVICTERDRRLQHLDLALGQEIRTVSSMKPLSPDEAVAVVRGMRTIGRLGLLAARTDGDIASKLTSSHLLAALLNLSESGPLERRLVSEFESLGRDAQRLYAVVAVAGLCGFSLKIGIAARAASVNAATVLSLVQGELRGCLFVADPERLRTRHRVIAEALCRHITESMRFESCAGLALALAPYVNRQTIMSRIDEARLAGRLLDKDNVEPLLGGRLQEFYEKIRKPWEWNSRFWEQYALSVLEARPDEALKFARTAVGIEPGPFAFTTLAKVQFVCARIGDYDGYRGRRLVVEGIDSALSAIEEGSRRQRLEVHPYDVAIREVARFVEWAADRNINLQHWDGWDKMNEVVVRLAKRVPSADVNRLVQIWSRARNRFGR